MIIKISKLARVGRTLGLTALIGGSAWALAAQTVSDAEVPNAGLDLPANLQIFGKADPDVRKPTAIVNDAVLTGTDVDQRLAMILALEDDMKLTDEQRQQLRLQVLRQLIDETLKIQEAKSQEITIAPEEISQSFVRVARNFNKTPDEFRTWLRQVGSSERTVRRQIEGELAWTRLLRRRVQVNVGEEEVKAIIDEITAAQGTDEFHLKEIYLSTTPAEANQTFAAAQKMIEQMKSGAAPFEYFASNFSEATTKSQGGDLAWVRLKSLPAELSSAVTQMQVGQVAGPIEVPGGFSILMLVDKRVVAAADPRDAKLNLRQLSIHFPAGTTEADASSRAAEFAKVTQAMQGCGEVAKTATTVGGDVIDRDIVVRDLPPQLQDIMLKLQIGESTPPFGSVQDGVRVLVLCGRDDPRGARVPTADQIEAKLEQDRVNLRAERMLRDLRRDALVDYR